MTVRILNIVILGLSLFVGGLPPEVGLPDVSVTPTSCLTFDEYGSLSFRNERARLDEYAKRARQASDSVAIIVIYPGAGRSAKRTQSRTGRIMDYLVNKRGVNPEHIGAVTIDETRQEFETQLLICPFFPPNDLRQMYKGKVILGTEMKKQAR